MPHTFTLTDNLREMARRAAERGSKPLPCRRGESQTRAYFDLYADLPLWERQARSLAYALANEPVMVFPHERLHGIFYDGADPQLHGAGERWADHAAGPVAERRIAEEVPEFPAIVNQWPDGEPQEGRGSFIIAPGGAPGHIAWNWHLILALGVEGLMERHRAALETARDERARQYYRGVLICLEAVLEWNRRHVEALRLLLDDARTPADRARLAESIAVMERVPALPARTFHEAVQSFYFQWLSVMYEAPYGGNSPGRLDYFLWPHLRRELEAGEITYQQAGELVAELFVKIDERAHLRDGHVNTVVLGGVTPQGGDAVNPLSFIMLDVFEQLNITHPAVYTRISEVNPPQWKDRCVEFALRGGNRAQILADEAIIAAMTREGRMPYADAAMYMCGGCMEISPHGMNSDLLFSFYYNAPKTLELVLTGGECLRTGQRRLDMPGSLPDCATFEDLYAAFVEQVRRVLHAKFRCLDIYSEEMARWRPTFLKSSMIADCLERGRSQQDGGARYADYGGTPVGLQNCADALHAVRRAVYEEGFCGAEELVAALRADFVGHEALRARLLALPKYGQGDAAADEIMARVVGDVCGVFDEYRNRHGGRVKPIIFTFVWAPELGRSLGASPDGRRSGEPVGHGLSPQSIGMSEGLTTCMNSYGRLPGELVSGGAATMWDMDPEGLAPEVLRAVLDVFIAKGGQIFQGNTTDVAELVRALEDPASHPNLFVRVGGFSARFVSLDRSVQEEIIERHRHRG